jgi:hypothetical protein
VLPGRAGQLAQDGCADDHAAAFTASVLAKAFYLTGLEGA